MTHTLADGLEVLPSQQACALPYYTQQGMDTEYLISNPNPSTVQAYLFVYGQDCQLAEKFEFSLAANCTQTFRIRPIVAEHAGHAILLTDARIIGHILYLRGSDLALVGGELAGRDNLFTWLPDEESRTYGFGYRVAPLGADSIYGAVYVSNPHASNLSGQIAFYDQKCNLAVDKEVSIEPGCTARYTFPKGCYGYGRIQVSDQAVINVLHFADSSQSLATAELVGESDRVEGSVIPHPPGESVLFDHTHGCLTGLIAAWADYEQALIDAGYTVAHNTTTPITLAMLQNYDVFVVAVAYSSYNSAEKTAIVDFVNQGGSLLIVQDFGNAPWSVPTREILNLFGANDDNNYVLDPTNIVGGMASQVVFDSQRNFRPHPIVNGWHSFHGNATASFSAGNGWTTVVETDDDSTPPRRPVLIARAFGSGRVLAFGDSNVWDYQRIGNLDNKLFGVRCIEWLLFRI